MRHFKRISTSTLGASLETMRHYYITRIRPCIEYACPVWFCNDKGVLFSTSRALINKLEKLQNECLRQIAGAFQKTDIEALRKELYIEPLEMYLDRRVMLFQTRALGTPFSNRLARWRSQAYIPPDSVRGKKAQANHNIELLQRHPYAALDDKARQWKDEANREDVDCSVKKLLRVADELKCATDWDNHRKNYRGYRYRDRPTMQEGWCKNVLKNYAGLDRAQSTLLFQCRTGFINLNGYRFKCKVCSLGFMASEKRADLRLF